MDDGHVCRGGLQKPQCEKALRAALLGTIVLALSTSLVAQRGQGRQGGAAADPAKDAPVDLTGYWVSVVTEDWRYRMVTPARGDHPSVPLNAAGNALANSWDPAKDEAAGETCKAYGAAGVMRAPGRLRITWQDDSTLKIETEAGTQTRLLRFGPPRPQAGAPMLQGSSAAQWELAGGPRGRGPGRGGPSAGPGQGNLKVVTTRMRPGYLQKNGVPYGGNAVLTEYFSRTLEPNGDSWLILTSIVEDPQYLTGPFLRSTHYKKLPENSTAWEPEPCSSR
jgi:hypothetical protein